jgi:hypothetical protein
MANASASSEPLKETIHGHPIVSQRRSPGGNGTRHGRVILVDRGPRDSGRWVTAWQGKEIKEGKDVWDKEWLWGHYYSDEKIARDDYHERCLRGY